MLPTTGGRPCGRYNAAVELKWPKRAALSWVCLAKVSSTTKPWSATRIAGCSTCAKLRVPQRSSACAQVAGVPGTPTDKPLVTASAKGNGCPVAGSMKAVGRIAAGAVSRPSRVTTRWLAAWK